MAAESRFRFDNYVVGSANRLAVAAARAVAESPGAIYNPLFIYSSSGLGKTHLMGAIGHLAQQLNPELEIDHVTLDDFVEQLHAAVSAGETESFKRRYQNVDLLLLDDVQFLTGRRETQSELLRLFHALQSGGRQVVLTSDRPPSDIVDVDERLLTRLAGGLVVDIGLPDYETRVAILRHKALERGATFRGGVIEELAKIDFASVRELQGALNRLIAHQSLGDGVIQPREVRALFGNQVPRAPTPIRQSTVTHARLPEEHEDEFANFLSDVGSVIAEQVEPWKLRLGEAIARYDREGVRTGVLQRALALPRDPGHERLLATFAAAVERLKALAASAAQADPALAAGELFRDPERVAEAEALVERALAGRTPPPGPSRSFTRDGYEVGASNQLAVRAADAIVADPGRKYNPLFLHGPSGVGKTHLAHAIGNELVNVSGGAMIVSVIGAQSFVDELIAALQDGTLDRWRARYRSVDALVIDDVQFVAGKERTQEELFHVFNALHGQGKQIVFTSDAAPKEMQSLEARLRSRFEGGLVVELQSPDRALREKLYARYLSANGTVLDPALVSYLADRPATSVREIMGVVHRLAARAEAASGELTVSLARQELEGEGVAPVPAPAVAVKDADRFFLDDEKVVWDWPDVAGRAIEEFR